MLVYREKSCTWLLELLNNMPAFLRHMRFSFRRGVSTPVISLASLGRLHDLLVVLHSVDRFGKVAVVQNATHFWHVSVSPFELFCVLQRIAFFW
mmetsp:Transcript_222/g.407  ORF Transcript_222/g.407 Transcript_222/m.407 type:complete len:94 (+) Transcript_222:757-1038(+)